MSRLKDKYKKEVAPQMMEQFKYKNVWQVPRLQKIVVNCCSRDCVSNGKTVDAISTVLAQITGQKPILTRARKAISAFKIREGQAIGAAVTLRGDRMYEFLDRLISISLPRVRDFRGLSVKGFDGKGNYTLGIKEQIIFPEIDYDQIDKIRGLNISIVSNAQSNEEGLALLSLLGTPFNK